VPIGPSYLRESTNAEATVVEDWQGKLHLYPDLDLR
jgi:hypothetical protein